METIITSTADLNQEPSTTPSVGEEIPEQSPVESSVVQEVTQENSTSLEEKTEETTTEMQTEEQTEEQTETVNDGDLTSGNITISGNELKELLGFTETETTTTETYDFAVIEEKLETISVCLQMILGLLLFSAVCFICKYIYKFFNMFC